MQIQFVPIHVPLELKEMIKEKKGIKTYPKYLKDLIENQEE